MSIRLLFTIYHCTPECINELVFCNSLFGTCYGVKLDLVVESSRRFVMRKATSRILHVSSLYPYANWDWVLRLWVALFQRRYLLMPVGVNHRVVLRSSPLPLSEWLLESSQALPLFPLPPPALYGPATWEARLAVEMKGAMHSFAKEALRLVGWRLRHIYWVISCLVSISLS